MKKLVFWDNPFHKKTQSTLFLKEVLSQCYDITCVWRGAENSIAQGINQLQPDRIVFFQSMPNQNILKEINCQNQTWVPMVDDFGDEKIQIAAHAGMRIIAFSKEVHKTAKWLGLQSLYLKYYPVVRQAELQTFRGLRAFFWQRHTEVHGEIIKKLIGNAEVEKFYLKLDADPGHHTLMPSAEDILKFNIEIIHGWISDEKYGAILDDCNIFFSPRRLEGIGMANLNAMAKGLCVVSPRAPAAIDYIAHQKNGLLYALNRPRSLDYSNLEKIRRMALDDARNGFLRWQRERESISNFIEATQGCRVNWIRYLLFMGGKKYLMSVRGGLGKRIRKFKNKLLHRFYSLT